MAPPLSELSLALVVSDWPKATALARSFSSSSSSLSSSNNPATVWSKRVGFFDGGAAKQSCCLPLHEACMSMAPATTVQAILDAHKDGARTKETAYGRLPLHVACRRKQADAAVIAALLVVYKAACLVPDDLGRLPLHYALSNGAEARIIHLLLTVSPESARGVDSASWTPLHVACATATATSRDSLGIITALLHVYPEAAIRRTDKGSTPTKCLCKDAPNRSEIKDLLRQARLDFDATFVNVLTLRSTPLLHADNLDAVLV